MSLTTYIRLGEYPVRPVLSVLLADKTTGRNIVWGTDSYRHLNDACQANAEITEDALLKLDAFELQPRVMKARDEQLSRTRTRAEVFTPSWICNKMNNVCDDEWFGTTGVFNTEAASDDPRDRAWRTTSAAVSFPEGKTWKHYVDSRRLEITCGEAPFIASRYDTSTGEPIEVGDRVGMLDRKLRVVKENVHTPEEWYTWARHAVESVYGYEFQGDNLLIARVNVLMTWAEHSRLFLGAEPRADELRRVANVISWNFWQMDGLTGTVPFSWIEAGVKETEQLSMFSLLPDLAPAPQKQMVPMPCRIYDWRRKAPLLYNDMKRIS